MFDWITLWGSYFWRQLPQFRWNWNIPTCKKSMYTSTHCPTGHNRTTLEAPQSGQVGSLLRIVVYTLNLPPPLSQIFQASSKHLSSSAARAYWPQCNRRARIFFVQTLIIFVKPVNIIIIAVHIPFCLDNTHNKKASTSTPTAPRDIGAQCIGTVKEVILPKVTEE